MLEKQKLIIESTNFDIGVLNSIKIGKDAIGELNKQMNVDDIAELIDEFDAMMAENSDYQVYFTNITKEGEDELLGEIDVLEAELIKKKLKIIREFTVPELNKLLE